MQKLRHIYDCEVVLQLFYLGSVTHSSGGYRMEIRRRIQLCRSPMIYVWKDRDIDRNAKTNNVKVLRKRITYQFSLFDSYIIFIAFVFNLKII